MLCFCIIIIQQLLKVVAFLVGQNLILSDSKHT